MHSKDQSCDTGFWESFQKEKKFTDLPLSLFPLYFFLYQGSGSSPDHCLTQTDKAGLGKPEDQPYVLLTCWT